MTPSLLRTACQTENGLTLFSEVHVSLGVCGNRKKNVPIKRNSRLTENSISPLGTNRKQIEIAVIFANFTFQFRLIYSSYHQLLIVKKKSKVIICQLFRTNLQTSEMFQYKGVKSSKASVSVNAMFVIDPNAIGGKRVQQIFPVSVSLIFISNWFDR